MDGSLESQGSLASVLIETCAGVVVSDAKTETV